MHKQKNKLSYLGRLSTCMHRQKNKLSYLGRLIYMHKQKNKLSYLGRLSTMQKQTCTNKRINCLTQADYLHAQTKE